MCTVAADTEHPLAEMATKKDLAELEARLSWRLITPESPSRGLPSPQ